MTSKLYLVDISNYLFRSFHALPVMTNSQGQQVQAVFGLARSLLKLYEEFHPSHLLAVFDGPDGRSKRRALYADYKSNRTKAPQELIDQIPMAYDLCRCLGIAVAVESQCEADDLIAAAVCQANPLQLPCVICSSDKDLLQLVGPSVIQLHTHKENRELGPLQVQELFGVLPSQMADYLALCGDSSDNIPGVAGIGPKTASQLLARYGSLEGIIEHLEELPAKRQQSFDVQLARLSKQLALLGDHPNWRLDLEQSRWRIPAQQEWGPWLEQMGFRSLIRLLQKLVGGGDLPAKELPSLSSPLPGVPSSLQGDQPAVSPPPISLELSCPQLLDWPALVERLERLPPLHPLFVDYLAGWWTLVSEQECWIVPEPKGKSALERFEGVLNRLNWRAYNGQMLYRRWLQWGVKAALRWSSDLRLAAHLLFADGRDLSSDALFADLLPDLAAQLPSSELLNEKLASAQMPLAEELRVGLTLRAWAQRRACDQIEAQLAECPVRFRLYQEVELPFASLLARMEHAGIGVDLKVLQQLAQQLHHTLREVAEQIYQLAGGEPFNLNSPRQLAVVLYDKLGLCVGKRSKTGPSTDAKTLQQLVDKHPIITPILRYRELEKLRSTYVDALPGFVDSSGTIHPHFEQAATTTGRLACHEPNLQNIPVRTVEGQRIRQAFIAREPTSVLVSADYSQIELRVMAHFSQDPALIKAFEQGEDIHRYTAALVFGLPLDQVSQQQRALAKAVNFGILYGQQAFGLSRQLRIPIEEAATFIQAYFQRYPGVANYIEECKAQAKEQGWVATLLGRRRYIPELRSSKSTVRQLGERLSVNTPIQGGAADLIKLAMLRIEPHLSLLKAQLLLQVHDELIFECPESQLEPLKQLVKEQMQHAYVLRVPLVVNIAVGKNWMEC